MFDRRNNQAEVLGRIWSVRDSHLKPRERKEARAELVLFPVEKTLKSPRDKIIDKLSVNISR